MADDQDAWERFKPIFTQLYVIEKKTLKDVKATMESRHGFPETPLKTYEAKLRDKLHLRKNLKAGEWSTIYNFVSTRRLTEFDCYFYGVLIPRAKVSKELRRYKPRSIGQPSSLSILLPPGIEVRERRAPDPLLDHRLTVRELSTQPEVDMPDVIDENHSLVPHSPPRISPASQHSDLPVDFGPYTPVNDLNTWGVSSLDRRQSTLSHNATPTNDFMDEFIDFSPAMSPASGSAAAGDIVVHSIDHQDMIGPHNSMIQRPNHHSMNSSRDRYLYAKYHLQNLPWIRYRLSLLSMWGNQGGPTAVNTRDVDGWSFALMPADGFFEHSDPGLPVQVSKTSFPGTELFESLSSSEVQSSRFGPLKILVGIVYLFSNNLQGKLDVDFVRQLFDTLSRMPTKLVFSIFNSNELSIRAVWEQLFDIALEHNVRTGLQLLITIGLRLQTVWIDDRKHDVLFAAASNGDISIMKKLLDRWHSWNPLSHVDPTCFGAAASSGAVDCAKFLLEKCDLGRYSWSGGSFFSHGRRSVFILFLSDFATEFVKMNRTPELRSCESMIAYSEILGLFIEAGIDIDSSFPYPGFGLEHFGWETTCLDICFDLARPAFERISTSSRLWKSEITRAGILNALLLGPNCLAEYLESTPAPPRMTASECLRIILVEQLKLSSDISALSSFELSDGGFETINSLSGCDRWRRVRALLHYGVSMRPWKGWDPTVGLDMLLEYVTCDVPDDDVSYLVDQLIKAGASITSTAYRNCMMQTGVSRLKTLISFDADFKANGRAALLMAARSKNMEAVSLLLESGVDINCESTGYSASSPSTILSHILLKDERSKLEFDKMQKMWEMFIENGAKLRYLSGQATCYQLLEKIIQSSSKFKNEAFQFVLDSDDDIQRLLASKWEILLELAVRGSGINFATIRAILRHCDSVSRPVLGKVIMSGCDLALMNDLIDAGQDVNEYSGGYSPLQAACARLDIDMVTRLLEHGADINSPTENEFWKADIQHRVRLLRKTLAAGEGLTALEVACRLQPRTVKMRERQERLVKLLVYHGANINAGACVPYASTALQQLCARDCTDLSVMRHFHGLVEFFIENGADVNIAPGHFQYSALQHCAMRGDIGQARILVQNDADPNAHPSIAEQRFQRYQLIKCESALDLAAGSGRLDMVQYLLNIEALSAIPGETGYDGAVEAAIQENHHAIVEVIRKHTEKLDRDFRQDPQARSRYMELMKKNTNALDKKKEWRRHFARQEGWGWEAEDDA